MLDDVYRALDSSEQATRAGRERLAAVAQFKERSADLVGRGEAVEGKVMVQTTSRSALHELTIDPRAMRLTTEELAAAVKDAQRAAADDLAQQTRRLLDEVGLTPQVGREGVAELRANAEKLQQEFGASVRSAAQQLDALARQKRGR